LRNSLTIRGHQLTTITGTYLSEIENKYLPEIESKFGAKIFNRFLELLTANYKVNFADKNKFNYLNAKLIYDTAKEKKYSPIEFGHTLKKFIEKNVFPNFTVANFFQSERLKLYPESWKNAEYKKDPNCLCLMECFVVKNVKMYRYYDIENPIIDIPNVTIFSENWDVGKLYSHQYVKQNKEIEVCNNEKCKKEKMILQQRINDLLELTSKNDCSEFVIE